MKDYYMELIQYAPNPVTVTSREDLKVLWKNEDYPCLEAFLDFYECFQQSDDIRKSYFEFFPFEDIHMEGGGLVFAKGHQNLYTVGVESKDLVYNNPLVKYQKMPNGRWFNECASLHSFLFNSAGWQILNLMKCVACMKANENKIKQMSDGLLFAFPADRKVLMGSNFKLFQNAEKNILSCFDLLDNKLYFAASDDEILNDFEAKHSLELNYL